MKLESFTKHYRVVKKLFNRKIMLCLGSLMLVFIFCLGIAIPVFAGPAGVVRRAAPSKGKTLSAPEASMDIKLGPEDPPAQARLTGWYCTLNNNPIDISSDLEKIISLMPDFAKGYRTPEEGEYRPLHKMIDWYETQIGAYKSKDLMNTFPGSLLEKSPVLANLDAAPGTTKIYTRQYCYTEGELRTLKEALLESLEKKIDELKSKFPAYKDM